MMSSSESGGSSDSDSSSSDDEDDDNGNEINTSNSYQQHNDNHHHDNSNGVVGDNRFPDNHDGGGRTTSQRDHSPTSYNGVAALPGMPASLTISNGLQSPPIADNQDQSNAMLSMPMLTGLLIFGLRYRVSFLRPLFWIDINLFLV